MSPLLLNNMLDFAKTLINSTVLCMRFSMQGQLILKKMLFTLISKLYTHRSLYLAFLVSTFLPSKLPFFYLWHRHNKILKTLHVRDVDLLFKHILCWPVYYLSFVSPKCDKKIVPTPVHHQQHEPLIHGRVGTCFSCC